MPRRRGGEHHERRLAAVRGIHPLALGARAQACRQPARGRCAYGNRARARCLHAPLGGNQHLGRTLGGHRCLGSGGGRGALRAGARQGVSASHFLFDSRRGQESVSASPTAATDDDRERTRREALCRYVLRLGDTSLVLGQRLSEWIGHAPELEEDLGLANLALDLIGQARLLLGYAGELEGQGRDEDALAFLRDAPEFTNLTLAEQPNGDFGRTIVRQWLLDCWQLEMYQALAGSADTRLAAIVSKAVKETRYHYRFSSGWLVRLGDGTEESHRRVQVALDELWRFTAELFAPDEIDESMQAAAIAPSLTELASRWSSRIDADLASATLTRPAAQPYPWQGKRGVHTEHLGHMLGEMQHLQRTYPGARW